MSYVANYPGIFVILAISCLGRVSEFRSTNCACGKSGNTQDRIMGGVDAVPHEYPWLVSVLARNRHKCGGALINHQYVLTAGHCFIKGDVSDYTIGIQQHRRDTSDGVRIKISEIIKHEKFESKGDYDLFDIALVRLQKPVQFSTILSPICLPSPASQNYEKPAAVAGWGRLEIKKVYAEVLQKTELHILPYKICAESTMRYYLTDYHICAFAEKRDVCQGDSGGPLMYEFDNGKWELAGIVSYGRPCGHHNSPGMYTNVSYFLDWIERNTRDDVYCTK